MQQKPIEYFLQVMYMNENVYDVARNLSDRINAAMRFKVYGELYASENYQVMNYGIGGSITPHVDSMGKSLKLSYFSYCHSHFEGNAKQMPSRFITTFS